MAEDKYNMKNPAVKRILQEVKEMQSNPSDDFMSLPLEVRFGNPNSVSKFFGSFLVFASIWMEKSLFFWLISLLCLV